MSQNLVDKTITELIEKYKSESLSSQSHIELEIRYKNINYDIFHSAYMSLLSNSDFTNPQVECSVNVISSNIYEKNIIGKPDNTSYIRQIKYTNGIPVSDDYIQKVRLVKPITIQEYLTYSIGLSSETKVPKFTTSNTAIVRFKVRTSWLMSGSWRFDLTAIKQETLANLGATGLKTVRSALCKQGLTASNFFELVDFSNISSYEIEIEYVGKSLPAPSDLRVASILFTLVNPDYAKDTIYQEEIYHIAKYISKSPEMFKDPAYRIKKLANQVTALTKNTYYNTIYPPISYYLTDKADGIRALVSVHNGKCRVLLSSNMYEFSAPDEISNTIADAELVYGETQKFTLYLFDCMVVDDKSIAKLGFSERVQHILRAAEIIHACVTKDGNNCVAKVFTQLIDPLEKGFRARYEAKTPYEKDGLIMTEPGSSYELTHNYKWKPHTHNTIDFLARKCPAQLLGTKPYEVRANNTLYILFVGISHNMHKKLGLNLIPHYKKLFPEASAHYYPIQFAPSADPLAYLYYSSDSNLDGKIVELSREGFDNGTDPHWIFHRVRDDRKQERADYGNDYKTAELTYINYIDVFHFEDLYKRSDSYFTKPADSMYFASNKFKRFVISLVLRENLSGAKWVIDAAAGLGADLRRYQEIKVDNAVFIDIDPTAIAELITRKFTYFTHKKRQQQDNARVGMGTIMGGGTALVPFTGGGMYGLTVHTLVADLKSPAERLIAQIYQFGVNPGIVDGIVCNFALHYLCDTTDNIRNMLLFVYRMLKVNGLFIFTVMDGARIFELLKLLARGEKWVANESGAVKYAIMRDYTTPKLLDVGQYISVLLPFSSEMYREPLCNIDYVVAEAGKLGMMLEINSPMSDYDRKFSAVDKQLSGRLSPEDKHYISLHSVVTLRKVKEVKKYEPKD
jgi:hypothetical protein